MKEFVSVRFRVIFNCQILSSRKENNVNFCKNAVIT